MKEYLDVIKEFRETTSAKILILRAFKEILPNRQNWFGFVLSFSLAVIFSGIISHSPNTVRLTQEISSTLLNVELAVFGCLFAVYSILLAFFNDSFIKKLGRLKAKGKYSTLKEYTMYYESALFLYFSGVGITGSVLLFCKCVEPYFQLTKNVDIDTWSAFVLLVIYLGFSFRVFYEVKSAIYNTICLFRASIAYKFIDFTDGESIDKNNKNDG